MEQRFKWDQTDSKFLKFFSSQYVQIGHESDRIVFSWLANAPVLQLLKVKERVDFWALIIGVDRFIPWKPWPRFSYRWNFAKPSRNGSRLYKQMWCGYSKGAVQWGYIGRYLERSKVYMYYVSCAPILGITRIVWHIVFNFELFLPRMSQEQTPDKFPTIKWRKSVWTHGVPSTGGTSLFLQIRERLEKELVDLAPQAVKVKVFMPSTEWAVRVLWCCRRWPLKLPTCISKMSAVMQLFDLDIVRNPFPAWSLLLIWWLVIVGHPASQCYRTSIQCLDRCVFTTTRVIMMKQVSDCFVLISCLVAMEDLHASVLMRIVGLYASTIHRCDPALFMFGGSLCQERDLA